ncbi:MAG: hypothetical protein Q9208_002387 [Pyrenodesmia sp. 3 TL-2023]
MDATTLSDKDVVMTLKPGVITIRSPTFTYHFHKPAKEDRLYPEDLVEYDKLDEDIDALQDLRALLVTQSDRKDFTGPIMDVWRKETEKLNERVSWNGWIKEICLVLRRVHENWDLYRLGVSPDGTLRI